MFPGIKSTCGLSNISNGPPDHLRGILNQTYMVMLERKGMYSCIADAYDDKLIAIARGKRPDVVEHHPQGDGRGVRGCGLSFQGASGLREDREGDPGPQPLLGLLAL